MAEQTLTMALNGEVPLPEFARAIGHFNALVAGLSSDIASGITIEWIIDELAAGSAVTTIRGVSEDTRILSAIVDAYSEVGKALQTNKPIPYSERVSKPARSLIEMLNGKITSVRFETAKEDIVISSHYAEGDKERKEPTHSIGTIKGVVESLSRRRGIRFYIYDVLFDRPIACYLRDGEEEKIKDFWGKKISVSGRISRDADTGKPFAIRDITQIKPVENSIPGSYRNARGVLSLREGETPASVIRDLRDA